MKRSLIGCAVLLAASGGRFSPAADGPDRKLFAVSLAILENRDGQQKTLAQPTMVVRDGEDARFLSGGEVPTDADNKQNKEFVEYGLRAWVTVREKAADRLRVSLSVSGDDLDQAKGDSDFVIRQSGARCEKSIKPGETFVVDMGEGRTARVSVLAVGGK